MAFLTDGFATVLAATATPLLLPAAIIEKTSVMPLGLDQGGPVDVSTMRNLAYRTCIGKKLTTVTEITLTVVYDPTALASIDAALGVNQLWTLTHSDTTTWAVYGFLDKFKPNAVKEGEQPTAEVTIHPSMLNTSNVEQSAGPVITP